MNNDYHQNPIPPTPEQLATMSDDQVEKLRLSNKRKLIWGLVCLIGPSALVIVSIILYAVVNFAFASSAGSDELFAEPSATQAIANVLMFIVGAVSILTWLPGIIIGIVLLATRKAIPRQN